MSSSKTIFNLIRLYNKIYKDESFSKKNILSRIGYYIPIALVVLAVLGLLEYSLIQIAFFFVEVNLGYEYLTFLFLLVQAIQLILAISNINRNLFGTENEDLPKLPATGTEIFVSKIIYLYIHELVFSTVIMLPFLFAFAAMYHMSASFYLMIIPTCILFPVVPFLVALVFSIPVMLIRKLFKNKFFVILLGSVISISIGYVLYIYALEYTLKLVFFNTTHIDFSPELVTTLIEISRCLIPERLLVNLLYIQDVGLSLLILLLITFIILSIVILLASKWYYQAFVNEIETSNSLSKRKSHIIKGGRFIQLAHKEFINIFRSSDYSFQYLALAASMPVMVFFCTKLSLEIGTDNIGELITPGLSLLVIVMFTALSSSFAASTFTREGNKMYAVKLIPESITLQLNAKLAVYLVVSFLSISISSALIMGFKFLDVPTGFAIWAIAVFTSFANILNAVKRDLKNPKFKDLGMGEMVVSTNNTLATIAIGILSSILFGGGLIALSYYYVPEYSIHIMLSISGAYIVFSILRLYIGINKCISRVEP